jgi:hypothetical protein
MLCVPIHLACISALTWPAQVTVAPWRRRGFSYSTAIDLHFALYPLFFVGRFCVEFRVEKLAASVTGHLTTDMTEHFRGGRSAASMFPSFVPDFSPWEGIYTLTTDDTP